MYKLYMAGLLWLANGLTVYTYAQTELSGSITDKRTGERLIGVPVFFAVLQKGAVTDTNGVYRITDLPPGMQTAEVRFIGYRTQKRPVRLVEGFPVVADFALIAEAEQLQELVVTGVTRATLIRQNPVPVVAITRQSIERTASTNIIDVLVRNTPGLNAVKTGPNISKPFIRGLGYNRVLTLYDGVRQEGQQWGDEHGVEVDGYGVDKAEVIKGPASLMYGSDALAGVVSLLPAQPQDTDGKLKGSVLAEYQSNNRLLAHSVGVKSGGSRWAWNFRESYRVATNYQNPVDGWVYNTGFRENTLTALVGYTTQKGYSRLGATLYNNQQGIPDGSRDSLTRQFTQQVTEADNATQRPTVAPSALTSYAVTPIHQHIQHYRVYTTNRYQLGEGELDVLLAFQQSIRREYNHPTQPTQPGLHVRLNTLNYGLRYNFPDWRNLAIAIGVNGMAQANLNKDATNFPIPDYTLFDIGEFVFLKWQANQLTLSGGLRYDTRTLRGTDFSVRTDPQTGFDQRATLPAVAGDRLQFPALRQSFTGLSASLGATYELSGQVSVKANMARGYRAPNITEIAANGLDPGAHVVYIGNRNFRPEFSLQQDLGVTGTFQDINLNLSVFNNFIQDYISLAQVVDDRGVPVISDQGNRTFQYRQSSAQLYGIEAVLALHPAAWKGFTLDNSIALIYAYNRGKQFADAGINGEYLPFIPPLRVTSSLTQNLMVRSKVLTDLFVKADVEINGSQNRYLALYNTETPTPGYTLVGLGLGGQIRYAERASPLRVLIQVNNLFDVAYQSNLSRLKYFEYYQQSSTGYSGIYSMGRNICLKLTIPF